MAGLNTVNRPERVLPEAGWSARGDRLRGPNDLPLCRWCQLEILSRRRRTFCSEYCVHQWRLRSDPGYLREQVLLRDRGVCAGCGTDTLAAYQALKRSRGKARDQALAMWGLKSVTARRSLWDADHILPVAEGGGQCDLHNLRTLCLPCHREATAALRLRMSLRQELTNRLRA
jgi:5-methylcytosine-specific restriction enzyme A